MAAIAFVAHLDRPEALELVEETGSWLEAAGHTVRVPADDAARAEKEGTRLLRWATKDDELVDGLDLAVSLGGDGTMLRTLRQVCPAGVPVLGVNVGHLGYLTECEPGGLRLAIERWLAGDHLVEARMTLEVTLTRAV